jgi:tetratricopeptide (TPR) repeat protein
VIVHYLRLALWPNELVIDYDDWPIARSIIEVLPQALLILTLLALAAYGLWRGHRLSFLGAWFFVILAPTSSFLPLGTEIAGERRMYLPTIAIVTLAMLGGRVALLWLSRRFAWRASSVRLSGALAILILAGAMIGTTVNRNDDYRTAVSIYGDAAAKRPNNARARLNLGVALYKLGETEPARQAIQQALDLKSNYPDAHYYLGVVMLGDANPDRAAFHFAAAQKGRPHWPLPYVRLGELLEAKGHTLEARKMYDVARKIAAAAGQGVLVDEIDAKLAALSKRGPA